MFSEQQIIGKYGSIDLWLLRLRRSQARLSLKTI